MMHTDARKIFGPFPVGSAPAAFQRPAPAQPAPVVTAGERDQTPFLFKPVWVTGKCESRLGYAITIGYPCCAVNIPGVGVVDAPIKDCHFVTGVRGRNYAYRLLGLQNTPCAALVVVPSPNQ